MTDQQKLLAQVIEMVLSRYDSSEIEDIKQAMEKRAERADEDPEDNEALMGAFVDEFDLGDWFYEQMQLNDIDIFKEIDKVQDNFAQAEHEAYMARSDHQRDYEESQGW